MTLVSLPSPFAYPGLGAVTASMTFATAATVTAAGHYVALVAVAREDMVVSHVSFRASTATGSPNIVVSIEDLDASGFPSGTPAFGSIASVATLVASSTNPVIALGASATIPKGTVFAVKAAYSSGTSLIIQDFGGLSTPVYNALPYRVVNTGAPTRGALSGFMECFALGSNSTTFYQVPGTIPVSAITNSAFNNTSAAKRGLKFTPPMNCRAVGLRWANVGSTGNFNAILCTGDASGTELSSSSTAFDGDIASLANSLTTVYFDNPVTLVAGTAYRVVLEPSSATNINLSFLTIPTDQFGATPAGLNAVYTTFVTATWTDSTTQIPIMEVIIDQVDNGSGTGGVVGVIGG